MMNDRDTLKEVLTDADFSQYEAEVYLSVLELGDDSVADIAETSPVPRSRVHGALSDLQRQGVLETYEGDSLRARIDDPSAVAEELARRSERFADAASGIRKTWEQPSVRQQSVQMFQDHDTTIDEAAQRLAEAETVVHLAVSPDELDVLRDTLKQLRDRDVVVRVALHEGYKQFGDPGDLPISYSAVAPEVRLCSSLLPFIALIDGDLSIFGIQSRHGSEYGVVFDDHTLSSILHWYFQIQLWEPWDAVYSSTEIDDLTYISIREFIREIESLRESDDRIVVRVEGIRTVSGEDVTVTGKVEDIVYSESNAATDQPFSHPFIQAAIAVDDGDDTYTIGGYGAILEDVRATRITVLSVD
ncbi:TrmB family transcriptional regulator [Halorubrum sp. C191]|uniref:TrmB family transcriptional regulator n=1 Tax=Halorubrum sp. C191 TaxID=1383842 RepID=UPI001303FB8F|nr:TrmB family transcriptional regulator sugar-binding domain-containing protein [Halorubrum sp. C191]